jgi:polysaccharide biosynthesis/export protein
MFVCMLAAAGSAFAQQQAGQAAAASATPRLQIAISSDRYLVTTGDTYTLTYWQAGVMITMALLVQSDFSIDMGVFGQINAEGDTFTQLKPVIYGKVTAVYPRGIPNLIISSLGAFLVQVKGDVVQNHFAPAWGLSRLSEIVAEAAGPHASERDVQIISADGSARHFDLWKARRMGADDQDPLVTPQDVVQLTRDTLSVTVSGEVQQPGTYQLLPGDDLTALIDTYGGGLTAGADGSHVGVSRFGPTGIHALSFDLTDPKAGAAAMQDGDAVHVHSKAESAAFIYFEGAVIPPASAAGGSTSQAVPGAAGTASPSTYSRMAVGFTDGETIYDALLVIRGSLSPQADLRDASVISAGSTDPQWVDLQALLADPGSAPGRSIVLKPFDRIIIPASKFYVYISGAVPNPGIYPYAANQTYRYYMALAGGPAAVGLATVVDAKGTPRSETDFIQPEDTITVAQSTVSVWGAVIAAGNYLFRPGQTASYYIALAGGVDSAKNTNGAYAITDRAGTARSAKDPILPGDRIHVLNNSFVYNFNLYFPVLSSTVTAIAAIATITQIVITLLPK